LHGSTHPGSNVVEVHKVIERILNLLAFLLTAGRPVTADEIRTTVAGYDQPTDDAFHRMFERDKDLLRRLGIPLELAPTDGWQVEHGYVVDPARYALPDPGFDDDERAALWLAAEIVRLGGHVGAPDALFKLGGAPVTGSGEPLAASLSEGSSDLGTVFAGISERRFVRFGYRDKKRTVAPYGLVHRRGHWYLVGAEGEETKAFRMDRAREVELGDAEGAFVRPAGFRAADAIPQAPWEAGSDDLVAEVVFDEEMAWWAKRQIGNRSKVEEGPGGAIRAEIPVANPEAFIGWLISFDDKAELVGPPELRMRFLSRIREAV
jgi:predicted DNA-binding transcriptional regulator YafY